MLHPGPAPCLRTAERASATSATALPTCKALVVVLGVAEAHDGEGGKAPLQLIGCSRGWCKEGGLEGEAACVLC